MFTPRRNAVRKELELAKYLQPPFEFLGVKGRVFPLRANIHRLKTFCEKYLNTLPKDDKEKRLVEFRPAAPYVFLAVLYYDKMFSRSQPGEKKKKKDVFKHLGTKQGRVRDQPRTWVSQDEVAFVVPVEWHKRENGRLVFYDWACFTPYIFVESDYSLTLGREVYGWPKQAANIKLESQELGAGRTSVMTLDTTDLPSALKSGEPDKVRRLVEIDFGLPPTFSQLRPSSPFDLLFSGPGAALGSVAALSDWIETLGDLPWQWRVTDDLARDNLRTQARRMAKGLRGWSGLLAGLSSQQFGEDNTPDSSLPPFNQITLKQFPATTDPRDFCYQAIINSQIAVTRYRNLGMLGDVNLMRGDSTGGFQVRFHYREAKDADQGWLMLDRLGLEVARQEKIENDFVATVNPVAPFWFDGDLLYDKGEKIWSRTKDKEWYRKDPPVSSSPVRASQKAAKPPYQEIPRPASSKLHLLREGTFERKEHLPEALHVPPCKDLIINVYPIEAQKEKLRDFCDTYLNEAELGKRGVRFEVYGSSVYLIVMSQVDDGKYAPREVAFSVPVQWREGGNVVHVALVSPYAFVQQDNDAIIDREWNGRPTVDAVLEPKTWLPMGNLSLEVKAETIPEQGSRPVMDTLLLTISQAGAPKAAVKAPQAKNDEARVLTLELLTGRRPLKSVAIKEFRDADDPSSACYQEIMLARRTITRFHEVGKLAAASVRIHNYASPPIVTTLGLGPDGDRETQCESPDAFWMHVTMEEAWKTGGKVLSRTDVYRRAEMSEWERNPDYDPKADNPFPTLGPEALQYLRGNRGNLNDLVDQWVKAGGRPLDLDAVGDTLENLEPLEVIRSILEEEGWGQR